MSFGLSSYVTNCLPSDDFFLYQRTFVFHTIKKNSKICNKLFIIVTFKYLYFPFMSASFCFIIIAPKNYHFMWMKIWVMSIHFASDVQVVAKGHIKESCICFCVWKIAKILCRFPSIRSSPKHPWSLETRRSLCSCVCKRRSRIIIIELSLNRARHIRKLTLPSTPHNPISNASWREQKYPWVPAEKNRFIRIPNAFAISLYLRIVWRINH